MNRQLRIFLAGAMVVVPFALTAYVVWWAGAGLDGLVNDLIGPKDNGDRRLPPGAGALAVLVGVYLVGLLMHLWLFRWVVGLLEKALSRVPVVKGLYEAFRDLLKLFGGRSEQMGQAVRYSPRGSDIKLLGIRTSTSPRGAAGEGRVAVYLPMSYQIGGYTVYVPADAVEPLDMSVEEALRIAATADVGQAQAPAPPGGRKD